MKRPSLDLALRVEGVITVTTALPLVLERQINPQCPQLRVEGGHYVTCLKHIYSHPAYNEQKIKLVSGF